MYAKYFGLSEVPFKIRLLKVPRKRHRKILSREELRHLLDCASKVSDKRLYGILLIAMHSGFRNGEILHLRWSDLDPEELSAKRIHLIRSPVRCAAGGAAPFYFHFRSPP